MYMRLLSNFFSDDSKVDSSVKYFNCANYNSRRQCVSTHYVRVDFLEQVVLGEIRRLTQFASRYENEFVKAAIGQAQQDAQAERQAMQKELKGLQKRDAELDDLFARIYEDNESRNITDERFAKMSKRYDEEQAELAERMNALKREIDLETDKSVTMDMFITRVRKHARAKKLTQRMLNELVDHIEAHQAEKIDGVHVQKLKMHYNCFGSTEMPNALPLPQPEVLMQTKKGAALSYSQSQQVVNL
jgi:hypothetical protein